MNEYLVLYLVIDIWFANYKNIPARYLYIMHTSLPLNHAIKSTT